MNTDYVLRSIANLYVGFYYQDYHDKERATLDILIGAGYLERGENNKLMSGNKVM